MSGCPSSVELARFVDGEFTRNEQAAFEEHLPGCARCRAGLDELRGIVADLGRGPFEPAPDLAPLVLARAAVTPPRRAPVLRLAVALAGVGAAGLAVGLSFDHLRSARGASDAGFRAKGASETADTWVALRPYRVNGATTAAVPRAGGRLRRDEPLLFAYDNGGPAPYRYLMVFAVDGGGRLYWYYPAGEGASVPVEPGVGRELRDQVRFDLPPGPLRLYGLFSRAPIPVAAVESALAGRAGDERLPFPDTGQHRIVVAVTADGR